MHRAKVLDRFTKIVGLCNKNEIVTFELVFKEFGLSDTFNHRMRVYMTLRMALKEGRIRRVRHGRYSALNGTGNKNKKKFVDMRLVNRLRKKGLTGVKIAKQLKVSERTLRRRIEE